MRDNSLLHKQIGMRIRETRQQKQMSQADLAERAHINLSHISDIVLGKKEMRLSTFVRIAEALQVSSDLLLRLDIPEVNAIQSNELAQILGDCTPGERESILKIVQELKISFHQNRSEYDT